MADSRTQALFREVYKHVDDAIAKALRGFRLPAAHVQGVIGVDHGGTGTGDGTAKPKGPAGGDLDGNYPDPTVDGIRGRTIASTAPADTQVLTWNGGANQWEPADATGGSGTVGPPGPPGPPGEDFNLPAHGGGALLVTLVDGAYVWAFPLFGEDHWLTGPDGEPLFVVAP